MFCKDLFGNICIWLCFPDWGWFVVLYHCWLIAIDHRCEHIEISRGWDMGWISGYSCSQLMRFLKSLPRLGPGYQICVHVSVLAPLPALGADTLTGNISNICHQLPILPHTTPLHTPVSICSHQSQLRRWKHGSNFICIGRYTTCLPHSHAALSWLKMSSKSSLYSP